MNDKNKTGNLDRTKNSGQKDDRARSWTFVVYPESTVTEWREILHEIKVPWVESPLHDKCQNPDGTAKKAHWHIVLLFPTKKSYSQIKEITDKLNAPIPQKVANVMGVVRYMTHMDNPEKTQYSAEDIKSHGGADIAKYFKLTATNRYAAIKEMTSFIRRMGITDMMTFAEYAAEYRFHDWHQLLCDNSMVYMREVVRACRENKREQPEVIFNGTSLISTVTGEVITDNQIDI